MPVKQVFWVGWNAWGNAVHTIEINVPPAWMSAQVSLHATQGSGTSYTGIAAYRKRLSSGADELHAFGNWYSWPAVIFDFVSSVTIAIATVSGQRAWLVARFEEWY